MFSDVEDGIVGRRLVSKATGASLAINYSNTILDMGKMMAENIKSTLGDIHANFKRQIINGVLKEYKIGQIMRFGYVRRYVFNDKEFTATFIEKTMGHAGKEIQEMNVVFTKRIPVDKALLEKGCSDYNNVIYTIVKNTSEDELTVSVDYQKYFVPYLNSVEDIKFDNILKEVMDYNNTNFNKWVGYYDK